MDMLVFFSSNGFLKKPLVPIIIGSARGDIVWSSAVETSLLITHFGSAQCSFILGS